jgi:hypothetical protein
MLRRILVELLPRVDGVEFTHAWGGNLGIPRDWFPFVTYDRRAGFAQAGGYVGDGVATANLVGRTLAAETLDQDSDLRSPARGRPSLAEVGTGALPVAGGQRGHGGLHSRGPHGRALGRPVPPRGRLLASPPPLTALG